MHIPPKCPYNERKFKKKPPCISNFLSTLSLVPILLYLKAPA